MERELARKSPRLLLPAVVRDDPQLIERIASRLPRDGALLAFRNHDDTLMTWVISSAGLIAAEQHKVHQSRLRERIRLFRDACSDIKKPWTKHSEELSRELSEDLLAPFAPMLEDHRRLMVVPSGHLHRLPLHALPFRGEPLVATHEISYLPAASLIARSAARRDHGGIAVFGNPADMRSPEGIAMPPLPGRRERPHVSRPSPGPRHVPERRSAKQPYSALSRPRTSSTWPATRTSTRTCRSTPVCCWPTAIFSPRRTWPA